MPMDKVSDLLPSLGKFKLDPGQWKVATSFLGQGVVKQLLTEGEKYVMTVFSLLTLSEQGIYDVVANLGSLAARWGLHQIGDQTICVVLQVCLSSSGGEQLFFLLATMGETKFSRETRLCFWPLQVRATPADQQPELEKVEEGLHRLLRFGNQPNSCPRTFSLQIDGNPGSVGVRTWILLLPPSPPPLWWWHPSWGHWSWPLASPSIFNFFHLLSFHISFVSVCSFCSWLWTVWLSVLQGLQWVKLK